MDHEKTPSPKQRPYQSSLCSIDEVAYKLVLALTEPHGSIHKCHLGNVNISDFSLVILFLLIPLNLEVVQEWWSDGRE